MARITGRNTRGIAPALIVLVALGALSTRSETSRADDASSGPQRMMRMQAETVRVDLPETEIVLPMRAWGGRPTVELTINETGPHRFILDTGAMITVIDGGLAETIGLPETGKQEIMSPAGDAPQSVARVSMTQVTLDAIVFHDLGAAVMDLAGMFNTPDAPLGVLSVEAFSGALLAIDYPGDRIVVRPGELGPADGIRIFQYEESDGHPTVPVSVAGTEIKAHLDTGSPSTFTLAGRYMKSLPLKSEPVHRGTARLVDGEMKLYGAPLQGTLRVGEYAFEDPEIVFADRIPSANLGHGFLEQFTLTLDLKNRRIRLDRGDGAVRSAAASGPAGRVSAAGGPTGAPVVMKRTVSGSGSHKRYGVSFPGIDGNPLVVRGVDAGSVAEAAGLQAGDVILRMNDRPVAELDSQERIGMLRAPSLTMDVERDGSPVRIEMRL